MWEYEENEESTMENIEDKANQSTIENIEDKANQSTINNIEDKQGLKEEATPEEFREKNKKTIPLYYAAVPISVFFICILIHMIIRYCFPNETLCFYLGLECICCCCIRKPSEDQVQGRDFRRRHTIA